mgnify:FL=1
MRTNIVPAMIPQVDFMEKVRRIGNVPAFIEDAVIVAEET